MPDRQQLRLEMLDDTVSMIFYGLLFVGTLAFVITLFLPEPTFEMLLAASSMCVLAVTGCVVWKLALGAMADKSQGAALSLPPQ